MKFEVITSLAEVADFHLSDPAGETGPLLYDSRLVNPQTGGCFFAFQSQRNDGHQYIPDLKEKGICKWVVSDPAWFSRLKNTPGQSVFLTENPRRLLASMAALHRSEFHFPIIAITGSNGKTIVKEWLSQLVEASFSVCKNPKSFNSQLGVPLSVWNLQSGHNLGIFEAGISESGEMQVLADVLRPDYGILTNLGAAHSDGFRSEEEKFREKLLLFKTAGKLVLSQKLLTQHKALIEEVLPDIRLLVWFWEKLPGGQHRLHNDVHTADFHLPFRDEASLENLGNCISMALLLGIKPEEISVSLSALNLPEMRLSLKAGMHGNMLIDDSYTNEPNGLEAALQFAGLQRKENQPLVLILSDMEGFSGSSDELQEFIRKKLIAYKVNQFIAIGEQMSSLQLEVPEFVFRAFPDLKAMEQAISVADFQSSVVLFKGARRFGMEKLVKSWQEKVHGTYLEINLDALVHNLNYYKSRLQTGTGIMAMVKALGYGSGDKEIASLLAFHRVDYLAVAYTDEGIKLREAGIKLPIMVMNPAPDAMDAIFRYGLEPEIYGFRLMERYESACKSGAYANIPPVHIKVDTGMHRLGFMPEEAELLAGRLRASGIKVATVFSHLAAADDAGMDAFSHQQIRLFEYFCNTLRKVGIGDFRRHILNSAGIVRFPEAAFEMVRLGIGLYGIEANGEFQAHLRPVSRLKTSISQVKNIQEGLSVGYGRREFLKRESRVATIAIGYSDGFRRAFSAGNCHIRYGNKFLPVLGNVCMDMTMLDVTDTNLQEGDEITIFETAEDIVAMAKAAGTIPYEILTGIGHRVKRIFYRE